MVNKWNTMMLARLSKSPVFSYNIFKTKRKNKFLKTLVKIKGEVSVKYKIQYQEYFCIEIIVSNIRTNCELCVLHDWNIRLIYDTNRVFWLNNLRFNCFNGFFMIAFFSKLSCLWCKIQNNYACFICWGSDKIYVF